MPRILLLTPADIETASALDDGLTDAATEVVRRAVAYPSAPPVGAHDWALADLAVLAAGQHAEKEGFDALCLADFGDYGANALRSVMDIPVVTAGRSAMLYALSLGSSFSVVAGPRDHARIGKIVHEYGLDHQCAGVLSADDDTGLAAAQVVVPANGAAAPGDLTVPVVDPLALVVKLAESLVGLGLSHSRAAYPVPQTRKAELIEAIAGAAR